MLGWDKILIDFFFKYLGIFYKKILSVDIIILGNQ